MNLTDVAENLIPAEEQITAWDFSRFSPDLLLKLGLILVLGALLIPVLLRLSNELMGKSKRLAPIQPYLSSALRIFLWSLLLLIVADAAGIPVTSIIALLGVAGLAVSLALQNTLSNLAGGLQILLSKPFVVGDFIDTDQGSGKVSEIGLAYCKLTSYDNKEILIPNHLLCSSHIINHTATGVRRVDVVFPASYQAGTQEVRQAIFTAMTEIPQIHPEPAPSVDLKEFGESAILYTARAWTSAQDYWTVHFGLMEQVRESFARAKIEIPYQRVQVELRTLASEITQEKSQELSQEEPQN